MLPASLIDVTVLQLVFFIIILCHFNFITNCIDHPFLSWYFIWIIRNNVASGTLISCRLGDFPASSHLGTGWRRVGERFVKWRSSKRRWRLVIFIFDCLFKRLNKPIVIVLTEPTASRVFISSAASSTRERKRPNLALECTGPWPSSYQYGERSTREFVVPFSFAWCHKIINDTLCVGSKIFQLSSKLWVSHRYKDNIYICNQWAQI